MVSVGLMASCNEMSRSEKKRIVQEAAKVIGSLTDDETEKGFNATTSQVADTSDWTVVGLPKASGVAEQILNRYAYVVSYNSDYRIPNWVMWRLTANHTDGPYKRDGIKFTEDTDVSNSPTTYDYQRTGYDRGHMCPSADNRWSQTAQEQCFLMTNIWFFR